MVRTQECGQYSRLESASYPYYSDFKFQYEQMLDFFKNLDLGSAIILHGGEHNPTGYDFSKEQWKEVGSVIIER